MKKKIFSTLFAVALVLSFGFMTPLSVVAQPSEVWVDDDFSSITPGWGVTRFATLQDGVDAIDSGGTVHVAAGTYREQITIRKPLWLKGEDQQTTIVEYPSTLGESEYLILILADAKNVRITGLKLLGHFKAANRAVYVVYSYATGLIVENSTVSGFIGVFGNLTDAEIRNNYIETVRKGIYVSRGNNLLVDRNTFEPAIGAGWYASNCGAIYMDHVTGVIISRNIIKNFSSSNNPDITHGRGIEGSNNSYVTISGNTFENIRDAITMWIVTNVDITRNYITASDRYGINIKGQDISITENTISNSRDSGINVAEYFISTRNVVINYNNIVGNNNFGVVINYDGAEVGDITVDATLNWWGHASGPSGEYGRVNPAGKVIGKGDAVSNGVAWDPWLRMPVWTNPAGKSLPPERP